MTNRRDWPAIALAVIAWVVLTALIAASILFIALRWGKDGFEIFVQQGVFTHLPITLASVTITWLLAGLLLYLLYARRINAANALTWIGFFLVSLVYLNVLRERFRYGDISYYIDAAMQLYKNQPLPDTYFYPPLWATLIEFIIPLGEDNILLVAWLFNILSLFAFYFLLHRVLEYYGFSMRLAALTTAGFMLINAPLLRALVYVQVNLHVMNLIFLGLLSFQRFPFVSALSMALAVHLKASPVVLVPAFLMVSNWRWLGWFILSNLLVAAITVVTNGFSPFLDFVQNITALTAPHDSIFHDTSFDSLLHFPTQIFPFRDSLARVLVYGAKGILLMATVMVLVRTVRTHAFLPDASQTARLFNAMPPLFILMTLASPVVWEHHAIFTTLSFLLVLKVLNKRSEWLWFGFAYVLEFVLPTFDFFPWSYGRLIAPLIVLWLMWRAEGNTLIPRLNLWLERIQPITQVE